MLVAAILHPLMGIPQIAKIYSTHDASGLSIVTWVAWLTFGLIFMAYGIAHKLRPYILLQTLWLAVDVSIIIGIIIYG